MKFKLSFGKGGVKGFVIQHAEKGIFGTVLLLVAVFIYSSATQEAVEEGESPSSLKGGASSALNTLQTANPWPALSTERLAKVDNYPALAQNARRAVDDTGYRETTPWIKELIPRQQKRQDPELFAPIQVEADGGVFSVLTRLAGNDTTWDNDKDAIEERKEPPKAKKPRRRRPARGSEMMGPEGMAAYPEEMAMPAGDSAMEMDPMMSGVGGGPVAGRRTLSQFYVSHYLSRGFRPSGAGGPGIAARSFAVVSVRALVPFEKQWEEYERTLANAVGYSPMDDVPKYLLFVAERAEVTDDANAPLQWRTISNSSYALDWIRKNYAAAPPELADEAYLSPTLTMPIPPILMAPYDALALHAEVPRKSLRPQLAMAQAGAADAANQPADEAPAQPTADFSEGLPQLPMSRTPGAGGYGAGDGMMPSMPYAGADPGYGGAAGMYEGGYPAPGIEGYGEGGYAGGPAAMPGQGGMPGLRPPLVKYKLVRFFDFTAEPGKSYRYRVRVMLEDPNRPRDPRVEPNPRILDQAVTDRLTKVIADDEQYQKANNKARRTAWRETAWSEPSNIVTVAVPKRFLAGGATAARSVKLTLVGPSVELEEGRGKVVTVTWDPRRATDVAAEREVLRGEFLDFTQTADVLQPVTLQIKRIEDFKFSTDAFVADLRGGEPLMTDVDKTTKEETPLPTPGEFLVVDGDGRLVACNEVDDAEEYRRLMFIEDRPKSASTSTAPGYDGLMMGP